MQQRKKYWIHASDDIGDRLSYMVTQILAIIAQKFVVKDYVPPLPNPTFLDGCVHTCNFTMRTVRVRHKHFGMRPRGLFVAVGCFPLQPLGQQVSLRMPSLMYPRMSPNDRDWAVWSAVRFNVMYSSLTLWVSLLRRTQPPFSLSLSLSLQLHAVDAGVFAPSGGGRPHRC